MKEALRLCELRPVGADLRMLDLGTGSGCLLLSAVLEVQAVSAGSSRGRSVTGVGLDISSAALEVAAKNASTFGLCGQICLVEGSFEPPPVLRVAPLQVCPSCEHSGKGCLYLIIAMYAERVVYTFM